MRTLYNFSQGDNDFYLNFVSDEKYCVKSDWYYSFKPEDEKQLMQKMADLQKFKTLPSWSADKIGRNLLMAFGENAFNEKEKNRAWIGDSCEYMVQYCFGWEYFKRCTRVEDLWRVADGLGLLYNKGWAFEKLNRLLVQFLEVRRIINCTFCEPIYTMTGKETEQLHDMAKKSLDMAYDMEWSLPQLGFKIIGEMNKLYAK